MMLWRGEMKKTLMTQRGIWVLLVCLVLKLAFLCAFPEQKDRRIVLSQKQYDKYLDQLYGENTREKSDWILAEYKTCKEVKDSQEAMQGKYARGELTDAQWEAYTQALTQADLHINSAQIFAEKAEQFLSNQRIFRLRTTSMNTAGRPSLRCCNSRMCFFCLACWS